MRKRTNEVLRNSAKETYVEVCYSCAARDAVHSASAAPWARAVGVRLLPIEETSGIRDISEDSCALAKGDS